MPKSKEGADFGRAYQIVTAYVQGESAELIAGNIGVAKSTVFRTLSTARDSGVFRTTVDLSRLIDPFRNLQTENALVTAFPNVRHATVIETPITTAVYDKEYDDVIHKVIGMAGADHLTQIVRSNDGIGVGSGRATSALSIGLLERPRDLAVKNTFVQSLAGGVPKDDLITPYPSEGANYVARRIARAQGIPCKLLFDQPFNKQAEPTSIDGVTIAVFGIGIIDSHARHPFMKDLDILSADVRKSLMDELIEANRIIGSEVAISETLNHLEILGGVEDRLPRLRELVNMLNSQSVGLSPEQLNQVPVRIAIAAGKQKIPAILNGISRGYIQQLVTDSHTASLLISQAA